MKEEDLLLKYCNYHPEFLSRIDSFPEKEKLLSKLRKEVTKTQFLSTISEFVFGELFHRLGFEIYFEEKFANGQTPDWSFSYDSAHAICDVYRLGKSNKDQIRSNFENKLFEKLESLNFNYAIKLNFIDEYFDVENYPIDNIILELKNWLNKSQKEVGDVLTVYDLIIFEILKINLNTGYLCCIGGGSSIDYKPHKVIQYEELRRPNEISKKLTKYSSIINENDLPFVIAIDIDFISGFNFEDFVSYFRGKRGAFLDYGKQVTGIPRIDQLGKEWTELGVFYTNPQLSGLILRYNNEFKLLLNPLKSQLIYKNEKILNKLNSLDKL